MSIWPKGECFLDARVITIAYLPYLKTEKYKSYEAT